MCIFTFAIVSQISVGFIPGYSSGFLTGFSALNCRISIIYNGLMIFALYLIVYNLTEHLQNNYGLKK
ncbi:MAG: hypothetical protein LBD03_10165 [Methanobrevibacter sp.]|nr:hypothetical protein [Candidatus Methanovirga procula]